MVVQQQQKPLQKKQQDNKLIDKSINNIVFENKGLDVKQTIKSLSDNKFLHFIYPIYKAPVDDLKKLFTGNFYWLDKYLSYDQDRMFNDKKLIQILQQNQLPIKVHCIGFDEELQAIIQKQLQNTEKAQKHIEQIKKSMQYQEEQETIYSDSIKQAWYVKPQDRKTMISVVNKPTLLLKFLYITYPNQIYIEQNCYSVNKKQYLIEDILLHIQ